VAFDFVLQPEFAPDVGDFLRSDLLRNLVRNFEVLQVAPHIQRHFGSAAADELLLRLVRPVQNAANLAQDDVEFVFLF